MKDYSFITNAHPQFIDSLYQNFKAAPASVEADWRLFFEGFEFANSANGGSVASGADVVALAFPTETPSKELLEKEFHVL